MTALQTLLNSYRQAGRLAVEMQKRHDAQHLSVVFSTYHSINVVSRAQQQHGLADFDLIICDILSNRRVRIAKLLY